MENPVVSVVRVDREPGHNDLRITLRFAKPSSEVREIFGISVVDAQRAPCRVFNIDPSEDIFADGNRQKYGLYYYMERTLLGYSLSTKTNIKLYTWTPREPCFVITMTDARTNKDYIIVADNESWHKHIYLEIVAGGYKVCNFNDSRGKQVYSLDNFTRGDIVTSDEIQINAHTGTLERR